MNSWKWLEDAKTVEILTDSKESFRFERGAIKEREWLEFYDKVADDGETLKTLTLARASFATGAADYRNAFANLKALVQELNIVRSEVLKTAKDIDAFFSPPGLANTFESDPEGLIEFCLKFVAVAYTNRVKNGLGE